MKHLAAKLAVGGVAAAMALAATAASAAAFSLKGAGSTLVQPLVQNVLIPDFQSANSGDSASYSGVGSTSGITDITNNVVDFGASDAPMTSTQQSACPKCVQIPWALSATGPTYNLSGINKQLKLTGAILAQIYMGKITSWNDSQITKINKGVSLPNEPITVVFRSDGSGDSFVFTSFLADTYAAFKADTAIASTTNPAFSCSTCVGKKGNQGVADLVASTPGAIGYVSTFYARDAELPTAAIENASGKYVRPYPESMTAAAALIPKSDLGSSADNTEPVIANYVATHGYHPPKHKKGKKAKKVKLTATQKDELNAYPMSTFTDVILRSDESNLSQAQQFVEFALSKSEQAPSKLYGQSFAPLPKAVLNFDLKQVKAL
jgi:phosphate transport system substrate-binding protein